MARRALSSTSPPPPRTRSWKAAPALAAAAGCAALALLLAWRLGRPPGAPSPRMGALPAPPAAVSIVSEGGVLIVTSPAGGPAFASPDAETAADPLDRRVSLDLRDVTAAEAFRSLARVAGVQVELDGLADEKVNLELENVRVRTLLSALCESLGCRWELAAGKPPRLRIATVPGSRPPARVKPSPAALDAEIDLHVQDANVRDLLETVAQITSTRPFIDSAVAGKVSLQLEKTAIREILDTICRSAHCTWSFDADKGVLAVRPKPQA